MTEATDSTSGNDIIQGIEHPVTVTDAALKAIRDAMKAEGEDSALRVSVVGGGCAGYQYSLDFEKEERPDDLKLEFDDVTLCIDPISANLLNGTTIDFVSGLKGTGFKFDNPNANRTCGCGHSFG